MIAAAVKSLFLLQQPVCNLDPVKAFVVHIVKNDAADVMEQAGKKTLLGLGNRYGFGKQGRDKSDFVAVEPEILDLERSWGGENMHDRHADGNGLDAIHPEEENGLINIGNFPGVRKQNGIGDLEHALGYGLVKGANALRLRFQSL